MHSILSSAAYAYTHTKRMDIYSLDSMPIDTYQYA